MVAVQWPYCKTCDDRMQAMRRSHFWMGVIGAFQMIWVLYAVGATMDYYNFWMPSIFFFVVLLFLFARVGKVAKMYWHKQWARIDDVAKGTINVVFTFRNEKYAEKFVAANQ